MIINSDYKPPWWLSNRHLQTLYPALFRQAAKLNLTSEQFDLPDGDFVDLLWTNNHVKNPSPIVIVLHGLEGSIKSTYTTSILQTIQQNNWRGVLMHFRGCSGRHNRLARSYHSGETQDVHNLIEALKIR